MTDTPIMDPRWTCRYRHRCDEAQTCAGKACVPVADTSIIDAARTNEVGEPRNWERRLAKAALDEHQDGVEFTREQWIASAYLRLFAESPRATPPADAEDEPDFTCEACGKGVDAEVVVGMGGCWFCPACATESKSDQNAPT